MLLLVSLIVLFAAFFILLVFRFYLKNYKRTLERNVFCSAQEYKYYLQTLEKTNEKLKIENANNRLFLTILAHDTKTSITFLTDLAHKMYHKVANDNFMNEREKLTDMAKIMYLTISNLSHNYLNALSLVKINTLATSHPDLLEVDILLNEVISLYKNIAEAKKLN